MLASTGEMMPPLRCARLGMDDFAILLQYPRPRPFADEAQKGSIGPINCCPAPMLAPSART